MKVVLSNKAYFNTTSKELWDHCVNQTSYQIYSNNSPHPKAFQNCGKIGEKLKWVPISRLDVLNILKTPLEIVDKRIVTPADIPTPTFTLREDQLEIYHAVNDTCIINGKPGFGKTILALAIAHKLGLKTLIICTNVMIRAQWEKEILKWFGFKPDVIGSGSVKYDTPIVVSNIQTLNKHSKDLTKIFGTVIVDEVHHCVATTFTNFLEQSSARYKIGLSGTLKRKDGLNIMFKDYFGYVVYSPKVNNTVKPTIHRYQIPVEISGNINVPWANRANDVYSNEVYLDHMVDKLFLYYRMGHKVLFVSDRVELIANILSILEEVGVKTFKIVGATDLDSRDRILLEVAESGASVLGASQSIFSEGVSLDSLSCLVIGSLLNNDSLLEQLAGRIQRIVEGKLDPILVDTILKGTSGWGQARGRMGTYRDNGWNVLDITPEREAHIKKIVLAGE